MWQKYISFVVVLIVSIACGSVENPTPVPQGNTFPQGSVDSSNSDTGSTSPSSPVLTLDSLETVPPADIIQEVAFFGGMGGGCGLEMCECETFQHSSPTLVASADMVEYLKVVEFQVCGIQDGEHVTVTVVPPSQNAEAFTVESRHFTGDFSGNMVYFKFTPSFPNVPGIYHFIFSGTGWEFDQSINVFDTDGPRLYKSDLGYFTFYKFRPKERVRLFAYENLKLRGWKEFVMDSTGALTIKTTINANFIAVGDASGQVYEQDQGELINGWDALGSFPDIYCEGTPTQSGISPTGNVELLVSNPPVYEYDYGSRTIYQTGTSKLKQGSVLRISSNSKCFNGSFYWLACFENDCHYIPESTNQKIYLRPTTSQSDGIPPAQNNNLPACLGTLPSRLYVGAKAEVTTSGMAPQLSLRAQPSMSAEKVHVIAAGRDMIILDGPVCAENSYWWYIRSEQGFEGWSREGDNEDYWIDPLP